jgi:hypothetical protein
VKVQENCEKSLFNEFIIKRIKFYDYLFLPFFPPIEECSHCYVLSEKFGGLKALSGASLGEI